MYGSQKEGGNFFNLLQKEGGNFFNLLQKEGGSQKGGEGVFPQKRGGSNPGGNYVGIFLIHSDSVQKMLTALFKLV